MSKRFAPGVYGIVPIELLQEPGITMNHLKVYTAIASFQGAGQSAWPSREMIRVRAGVSTIGKVSEGTSWLEKHGWIEKRRRGQQKSNVYSVLIPSSDVPDLGTSENPDVPDSGTPDVPDSGTSSIEKNNRKEQSREGTELVLSKPADPRKELGKKILSHFKAEEPFTNSEYPREAKSARMIADRVVEIAPESSERASELVLSVFKDLVVYGDNFWRRQPYRASTLVSQGIWSRVMKEVREKAVANSSNTSSGFTEDLW